MWHGFTQPGIWTNAQSLPLKDDPQTGDRSYYLAAAQDIPPVIPLIAGDVIHNLRSALDHLAYHLVYVGTGGAGPFKNVYFPISRSTELYRAERGGKVRGMRQDAVDAIDAIEPYRGGAGHTLWQLHALNIIDKHRLILTGYVELLGHSILPSQRKQMTAGYRGSYPGRTPPDFSNMSIMPRGGTRRLREGEILLTVPAAELEKQMNFVVGISFGEPQVLGGDSMVHTLERMAQSVELVLRKFADLGLLP